MNDNAEDDDVLAIESSVASPISPLIRVTDYWRRDGDSQNSVIENQEALQTFRSSVRPKRSSVRLE